MKIQKATIEYTMEDGSHGEFTGNAEQVKDFIGMFEDDSNYEFRAYYDGAGKLVGFKKRLETKPNLSEITDHEALKVGDIVQAIWDQAGSYDEVQKGDRLILSGEAMRGSGAHFTHDRTGKQLYFIPSEIRNHLQKVED